MLSICRFFTLRALLLFFRPYLAPAKCQEQKGEKERNYRADYSWGLADKMLTQKLRPVHRPPPSHTHTNGLVRCILSFLHKGFLRGVPTEC